MTKGRVEARPNSENGILAACSGLGRLVLGGSVGRVFKGIEPNPIEKCVRRGCGVLFYS